MSALHALHALPNHVEKLSPRLSDEIGGINT